MARVSCAHRVGNGESALAQPRKARVNSPSDAGRPDIVSIAAQSDQLYSIFSGAATRWRIVELRPYKPTHPQATESSRGRELCQRDRLPSPVWSRGGTGLYRSSNSWTLAPSEQSGRYVGHDLDALPHGIFACPAEEQEGYFVSRGHRRPQGARRPVRGRRPGARRAIRLVPGAMEGDLGSRRTDDRHQPRLCARSRPTDEADDGAGNQHDSYPVNGVPAKPAPANRSSPRTDLAHAPYHLGAFQPDGPARAAVLSSRVEYLAHRYSDPSGRTAGSAVCDRE